MSRAGNITIAILMWCAIAAYIVAAGWYARQRRAAIDVHTLRIAIVDTASSRVVTVEKVRQWLGDAAINPIGQPIDSASTRAIECVLAEQPEVKHVSAWTDLGGILTVRIEPRIPAMRVRTDDGCRFWYTNDGVIIPDRGDFAAYVPVVTGRISFPFSHSTSGSYARMQADNRRDFYERFKALAAERNELNSRLNAARAEIRSIRASTPRRWWSADRKKTFAQGKTVHIAELEKLRGETVSSLSALDKMERSLREKEKKSYESHRFLSKLANFVEFIGRNDFWAAQIVQIHVTDGGTTGSGEWHEPQLELIPRAGNHVVLLGELDGTERRRLDNLHLFYTQGLWHEGWDAHKYINIKYANQIVCTK